MVILGLEEDEESELHNRHVLDIDIIDTGLGIDKERQNYLFVPFKELKAKQDVK